MLLTEARRTARVAGGELVPLARAGPRRLGPRADRRGPRPGPRVPGDRPPRPVPDARRDQRRPHRRARPPPTPTGPRSRRSTPSCTPSRRRRSSRSTARSRSPSSTAPRSRSPRSTGSTADGVPRLARDPRRPAPPARPQRRGAGGVRRRDRAHRERGRARLPHPAAWQSGAVTPSCCTPPARCCPAADDALGWVEHRNARRAGARPRPRRPAAQRRRRPSRSGRAAPVGRGRRWRSATSAALGSLLSNVHPEPTVRTACEEAEVEVDKLVTELRQDRGLYDVFAALDAGRARPDRGPAAGEDARGLPPRRRRPGRRDPRPARRDQRADHRRSTRSSAATSATTSAPCGSRPSGWPACRRTGSSAHPADDEGLVTVTTDYPDAVPARMFVHDPEVRRDGRRSRSSSAAGRRTSRCCASCSTCATSTPTWSATPTGRRTTPTVKMIGKGPAIPEFIDRIAAGRRGADASATSRCCSSGYRQDVPGAEAIDARRLGLLRGAGPQGAARRRLPAGADLLRLREGAAGAARRDRPAVRAALRAGPRRRRSGTRTSRRTTSSRRASRDDGESARPDLPRPAPARGQVQARRAVHDRQRRGRPAAARGRAGLQLQPRADGARPRGHAVPRVRPPGPPRARRARRRGPGSPASPPSGTSSRRRARCSRSGPGTPTSCRPSRPNAAGEPIPADLVDADARGRRLRQGLPGPAADVLRRDVLLVPHRAARPT